LYAQLNNFEGNFRVLFTIHAQICFVSCVNESHNNLILYWSGRWGVSGGRTATQCQSSQFSNHCIVDNSG